MKNLIGLLALLVLFTTNVFAQSPTEGEKNLAESYILEHNHDMNKSSDPVFVESADSLNIVRDEYDDSGINSTIVTYVFVGDTVDASKRISFSIDAAVAGTAKPYILYSIATNDGLTTLTMLCGNSSM